jgi:hypothetical protein
MNKPSRFRALSFAQCKICQDEFCAVYSDTRLCEYCELGVPVEAKHVLEDERQRDREGAFRKGYSYGAGAAFDTIKEWSPKWPYLAWLADWANRVTRWRYDGDSGRTPPPNPQRPPKKGKKKPADGLIGKSFHTMKENGTTVCWQGEIIDRDGDLYVAQLYEWMSGCSSTIERMSEDDLLGKHPNGLPKARIYNSFKERNEWYGFVYDQPWAQRLPTSAAEALDLLSRSASNGNRS